MSLKASYPGNDFKNVGLPSKIRPAMPRDRSGFYLCAVSRVSQYNF